MAYAFGLSLVANFALIFFENGALRVFTDIPEVIHYAKLRFHYVLMFQSIAASYEISGSYMRGLGYSVIPMLLTIFGSCILRLIWVWIFPHIDYSYQTLLSIYPISWAATGVMVVIAAFIVQRKVFKTIPDQKTQGLKGDAAVS